MIIDSTLVLSPFDAITASAPSTNVIDLGTPGTPFNSPVAVESDIGKFDYDGGVPLNVAVTQAFNNLTSLAIQLQTSPDNATWSEVATRTYTLAQLGLGQLDLPARLPVGTKSRYIRLYYTVNGTAPTTGQIWAGVVAARQSNLH